MRALLIGLLPDRRYLMANNIVTSNFGVMQAQQTDSQSVAAKKEVENSKKLNRKLLTSL